MANRLRSRELACVPDRRPCHVGQLGGLLAAGRLQARSTTSEANIHVWRVVW